MNGLAHLNMRRKKQRCFRETCWMSLRRLYGKVTSQHPLADESTKTAPGPDRPCVLKSLRYTARWGNAGLIAPRYAGGRSSWDAEGGCEPDHRSTVSLQLCKQHQPVLTDFHEHSLHGYTKPLIWGFRPARMWYGLLLARARFRAGVSRSMGLDLHNLRS